MEHIVILTGAGISKESGLDTFRDAAGLWQQVRMEDVMHPQGFRRDPHNVHAFHNMLRSSLLRPSVSPNPAHAALARLEKDYAGTVLVVTQNIDDLHERAGSHRLLHMHGELCKARCTACHHIARWTADIWEHTPCPSCGTPSLRPHVVWFEEVPLFMPEIEEALTHCTVFLSIGTSGAVYPAAGFAAHARSHGAKLVELNMEPTGTAGFFHEGRYGPAGQVVPAWVETFLQHN